MIAAAVHAVGNQPKSESLLAGGARLRAWRPTAVSRNVRRDAAPATPDAGQRRKRRARSQRDGSGTFEHPDTRVSRLDVRLVADLSAALLNQWMSQVSSAELAASNTSEKTKIPRSRLRASKTGYRIRGRPSSPSPKSRLRIATCKADAGKSQPSNGPALMIEPPPVRHSRSGSSAAPKCTVAGIVGFPPPIPLLPRRSRIASSYCLER